MTREIPCPLSDSEIRAMRQELYRMYEDGDAHPANRNAAAQLINFYGAVLDSRME